MKPGKTAYFYLNEHSYTDKCLTYTFSNVVKLLINTVFSWPHDKYLTPPHV